MKKIYLLLTLMIFMSSCEKEEVFEIHDESSIMHFSTVPQKAAIDFLKSVKKNNSHRQSEIIIHYDQLHYDTINNSTELLTVIPAQSKFAEVDSRVLILEVDGNIESVLFNLVPEIHSNDTLFTGKIIISNLDLKFITGFRVKNGNLITQFVKKENLENSNKCKDGVWEGIDMDCFQNLDEAVVTTKTPYVSISYIYPLGSASGYDGGTSWSYPSGGGGGTTTLIPDEEEALKVTNELKEKANCIFNKLGGTAVGNLNIMHNIFLTFSDMQYNPADIIYRQQAGLVSISGVALNGRTKIEGNDYIITLNSDRINNRSSVEIAKTILHESVHAILARRYNINPENFMYTFKKYIEQETDFNIITHAVMREHYIDPMIKNLRQFDNYRENEDFYRKIAWEGLHQYLTQAEKEAILATLNEARARDGAMNCGRF